MMNVWLGAVVFLLASCGSVKDTNLVYFPGTKEKAEKGYSAQGKKFAIATQGRYTTAAAKEMFDQGGNIADAAVAASFVISVERPQSTGIGGGGFLLFHKKGAEKPESWDFRERAPLLSHSEMYLDEKGKVIREKSKDGIHAVGVPGLVKGLLEFHKAHGKLDIKKVIAPAIKLARDGFPVYPELNTAITKRLKIISKFKDSKKIFLNKKGEPLKVGTILKQEDLAKTLELIVKSGINGFYKGRIAKSIVKTSKKLGGILQLSDFKKYQVKKRDAVSRNYGKNTIYSMAPPSSGGIHVLQILGIVEKDKLENYGPYHSKSMHLTAAAMQAAFVDRAKHLGDPDYQEVPVKKLLSEQHIKDMRNSIPESMGKNHLHAGADLPKERHRWPHEKKHTTHFSLIDSEGNVISSTQTINGLFGSAVVAEGTGIVLNNEMDDFAAKKGDQNLFGAVGGDKNLVEPLKTPLSSMSPTIVLDENKKPILAVGSPNGTRIITCVALTLLNRLEHKLPLYDSVALARYHHQWLPNEIRLEELDYPKKTVENLKRMTYELKKQNYTCRVQAVENSNGVLRAVSDPRGEGMAFAE
jgi:gamma-glutamyltranspeptidase/glutathione hydrolase